jgi:hypothetical protein
MQPLKGSTKVGDKTHNKKSKKTKKQILKKQETKNSIIYASKKI